MNQVLQYSIEYAPMVWFAVGLLGSALESFGEKFGKPKLVALGQRLESLSVDVPKLIRGSRFKKEQGK